MSQRRNQKPSPYRSPQTGYRESFNASYGRRPSKVDSRYKEEYGRFDRQFNDRDSYNEGEHYYDQDFGILGNDDADYRPDYNFEERANIGLSSMRSDFDYHDSEGAGPYRGIGPKGYRRSDDRINEDISDRLSDHSRIDAENIAVKVEGGEVYLRGSVPDRKTKRLAEDVCMRASGVSDVMNELRIQSKDNVHSFDQKNEKKDHQKKKANK